MVPNIKSVIILLSINFGLLLACGEPSSNQTQARQNRQASGKVVTNSSSNQSTPQKNSSDAHRDIKHGLQGNERMPEVDVDEEEIQASRPAVISGAHLACVPSSTKGSSGFVPTNCTISPDGLKHTQIVDKSLFVRLGTQLVEVDGDFKDGSYEFSLAVPDENIKDLGEIRLYVLSSDADVLEQIGKL